MNWFRRKKIPDPIPEETARLDGRLLSYVTKRVPDETGTITDVVVGKGGRFGAAEGFVFVIAADDEVFRCPAGEAMVGELMSGNGAVVSGVNLHTGEKETYVAHFSYYR